MPIAFSTTLSRVLLRRLAPAVAIGALAAAGALWASQSKEVRWVRVAEPRDRHAEFFYERQFGPAP